MYKITTVCNAGVGTSAFARSLIESAVTELGYDKSDFLVECTDISGASGLAVDLIVTTPSIIDRIPPGFGKPVPAITVKSLVSGTEEMKAALTPYLEEAVTKGKIQKLG